MSLFEHLHSAVSSSSNPPSRRFLVGMLLVVLAIGVIAAWDGGNMEVVDDGTSYSDLADAWLSHDWNTAANGYWSPAYPWLLAGALRIFQPSLYWEPVVVRGVNLFAYLVALLSFTFFWRELTRSINRRATAMELKNVLPQRSWLLLGVALFTFCAVGLIRVQSSTPDMCLSAAIFSIATILVRMKNEMSWTLFAWLGVVLGLGYLIKAVMFPMAFVFLVAAYIAVGNKRQGVLRLVLTSAVFVVISGPWILLLSHAKGRFTFGDSGKLSYLWFVNQDFSDVGYPFPWNGSAEEGTPRHPMRELLASPHVFEFSAPYRGSYPLWNDPSYWYEGAKVKFHLKQQMRTVRRSISRYIQIFERQSTLLAGTIFLLLVGRSWKGVLSSSWYLLLPAITGLALYGLVLVNNRYIAAFLVLLWSGLFAELYLLHLKGHFELLAPLSLAMAVTLSMPLGLPIAADILQTVRKLHVHSPIDNYDADVAAHLREMGLRPGDRLGYFQAPQNGTKKYWARLAKMTIVTDMSYQDVDGFWQSDPATQARVIEAFGSTGVRAIVAFDVPAAARKMGWQKVGKSDYYVLPCCDLRQDNARTISAR